MRISDWSSDVCSSDLIACVGRTPAEETVAQTRALGRRAEIVSADLSTIKPVGRVVDETVEKLGRLDILVNNAGIIRRADSLDFTEEDWDAEIGRAHVGTPVTNAHLVCRLVLEKKNKPKL